MRLSSIKKFIPEKLYARLQLVDHYLRGERELHLLWALCDRKRVSLDIGANIGTYTYFMRWYSCGVYAYEPNPELSVRLSRLYPDVVIRQAAVSDSPGELRLRIPVQSGRAAHELASVAQSFDWAEQVIEHIVLAVRIDDENCGDVGFIKIDVEQHEIAVINGALETIRKCKPVIMTEVSPLLYPRPLPDMFKMVLDMSYSGWFRFQGKYHSFSVFSESTHANKAQYGNRFMDNNVIFLPPGHRDEFLHKHRCRGAVIKARQPRAPGSSFVPGNVKLCQRRIA
jgi:FkbM family methyltransferase